MTQRTFTHADLEQMAAATALRAINHVEWDAGHGNYVVEAVLGLPLKPLPLRPGSTDDQRAGAAAGSFRRWTDPDQLPHPTRSR